ncbi:MAG: Holliday junction branch migration protein RuvA [Cytophagales bacterium]|nr:Holliday junction branch migration protein RuvA [Cytophagales bacterium]
MIGFLRGKTLEISPSHIVLDVQGVGYYVHISLRTYSQIKDKKDLALWIYDHHSDKGAALYGFKGREERTIFFNLISVSGVGPSTGLAALSTLSAKELVRAIISKDLDSLGRIKGIGKRTAQRILVELSDRLPFFEEMDEQETTDSGNLRKEALGALISLGIPRGKGIEVISRLFQEKDEWTLEDLIKQVLRELR